VTGRWKQAISKSGLFKGVERRAVGLDLLFFLRGGRRSVNNCPQFYFETRNGSWQKKLLSYGNKVVPVMGKMDRWMKDPMGKPKELERRNCTTVDKVVEVRAFSDVGGRQRILQSWDFWRLGEGRVLRGDRCGKKSSTSPPSYLQGG